MLFPTTSRTAPFKRIMMYIFFGRSSNYDSVLHWPFGLKAVFILPIQNDKRECISLWGINRKITAVMWGLPYNAWMYLPKVFWMTPFTLIRAVTNFILEKMVSVEEIEINSDKCMPTIAFYWLLFYFIDCSKVETFLLICLTWEWLRKIRFTNKEASWNFTIEFKKHMVSRMSINELAVKE